MSTSGFLDSEKTLTFFSIKGEHCRNIIFSAIYRNDVIKLFPKSFTLILFSSSIQIFPLEAHSAHRHLKLNKTSAFWEQLGVYFCPCLKSRGKR